MQPAITLLVPIYNVERHLRECLDSAAAQKLDGGEAIEVICINDGSTDSSRSIVQEYIDRDSRFKVIDKPNSGYGASMNMGLGLARGEFVGVLESDDIMLPGALRELLTQARANGAQVARGDFEFYWSGPPERFEPGGWIGPDLLGMVIDPADNPKVFYRKPTIWSAIYRRDFLQGNSVRFLETPGASYQDAGFNFKVWASCDRAVFTTVPIIRYRQDNEKSSVNSPGKVFCVCDEYAGMQAYLDERPELRERLEGILQRMKYDSYMWNYERLSPELALDFLRRASEEFSAAIEVGDVDMDLFERWAQADLGLLVRSPELFDEYHRRYSTDSKMDNFKRYFKLGGPSLVLGMMRDKFKSE